MSLKPRIQKELSDRLALIWIGSLGVAGVLEHFHKPGHYGILEIVAGVAAIVFTLMSAAAVVALVVGGWMLLASSQNKIAPRIFIPVVLAAGIASYWFGTSLFQGAAFLIWEAAPWSLSYVDTIDKYRELCQDHIQDDQSSWHYETDWHTGRGICQPLQLRVRRMFPRPEYIFGPNPWIHDADGL